jgi:hypothetical protein
MKKTTVILILILFTFAPLFGAGETPVNEDEMFSDPNTVLDSKKFEKKKVDADTDVKKIGISGEITSVLPYTLTRESVMDKNLNGNLFDPYIDGVLFTDIRLPARTKAFGNFELQYNSREDVTTAGVRELFVDFNFGGKVYFRTGKQVLQWGRCYLWNPTDHINVENKTFEEKIGSREGGSGLKMHIPFGTVVNIYGFIDTLNAENINQVGGSYKMEALLGSTEMALSIWGKKENHPVYGYDFSTRILSIDIMGEASASYGSNMERVVEQNGILTTERRDKRWVTKASLDLGHSFDFGDQADKVQVNTEFFYNGDGYEKDYIRDETVYLYDEPVTLEEDGETVTIPAGIKAHYLLGKGLYEPNYHSPWYGALFITVNKFFRSELSLKLNLISNIQQASFIAMTGISYADINNFKAGITFYAFLGKDNTEYTFHKNSGVIQLTAGVIF